MNGTRHPSLACVLGSVAVVGMAIAWSACSKVELAGEKTTPPPPGSAEAASKKVTVFTWQDYFSPEVCEEFTKETGIEIEWRYYENLGEMNALLRSEPDAFDVVVVDDMSLTELIELQMLRPIHKEKLPNLPNIDPKYLNRHFDPENHHSVPYMWGTTLVAYRKDKIPDPTLSWSILWDPALKGKVLMLNEKSDLYAITLLSMGLGFNDVNSANLQKCTEKLIQQIEEVDVTYTDIITAREKVLSGEFWAFLAYSGDAAVLVEEDPNIAYFIPHEGAPLWLDSFAIPKEAPRAQHAHTFIDFMSRAKVAAMNANFLSYATANRAALEYIDKELLSDVSIYPSPEVLAKCDFIPPGSFNDLATNQGMKRIFDLIHRREWADGSGQVPANPPESISTDLVPGQ